MGNVERFEDLRVWQTAREIVEAIYKASSAGAFSEDYALRDQIRRAAISIPSNIVHPVEYVRSALFHGAGAFRDARTRSSFNSCSSFTP